MPYMRTFYKQTGSLEDGPQFLGPAYVLGSYMSGAGLSFRNPSPYLFASVSSPTGSVTVGAYQLMSAYYGGGIFGSGYVYVPIGVAVLMNSGNLSLGASGLVPIALGAIGSVVSLAKSLGGVSGGIGFGPYNSGSTAHFAVLGLSMSGTVALATYCGSNDLLVTFLMVSAPPFHELGP